MERRKDGVESTKGSFGVRVELIFASSSLEFVDEEIQVLRIQNKGLGVTPAEFEHQFRENPEEWPWFTKEL